MSKTEYLSLVSTLLVATTGEKVTEKSSGFEKRNNSVVHNVMYDFKGILEEDASNGR